MVEYHGPDPPRFKKNVCNPITLSKTTLCHQCPPFFYHGSGNSNGVSRVNRPVFCFCPTEGLKPLSRAFIQDLGVICAKIQQTSWEYEHFSIKYLRCQHNTGPCEMKKTVDQFQHLTDCVASANKEALLYLWPYYVSFRSLK